MNIPVEDKISALTTRDPNKLKVYLDFFDGHSLRAAYYYNIDVDLNDPESVNAISELFPDLRQDSKPITFALTYGGTWYTLHIKCGLSKEKAKEIEANYHKLYRVSTEYIQAKIKEAENTGYVTLAFGLKLRTPLINQSKVYQSNTPSIVAAEARTAGNALGQSWGMLNNRAANEFMQILETEKPEYRKYILPVAHIHHRWM